MSLTTATAFASGASFVLPPFVFRQAHLEAFDQIIADVRAAVPRAHDDEAAVVVFRLCQAVNAAMLHAAVAEEDDVAFVQVRKLTYEHGVRGSVPDVLGRVYYCSLCS